MRARALAEWVDLAARNAFNLHAASLTCARTSTITYTRAPHPVAGFALRGNMSDPEWAAASSKAFDEGTAFLKKNLGAPSSGSKGQAATKAGGTQG